MSMADDNNLVIFLAGGLGGGCSLDSSPKKNWVEKGGGLPQYICKIAKSIMKTGKSKSSAIAIAVSRVKVWAGGGGGVDADTKAKAATALAQWNALKAKNKSGKLVKMTNFDDEEYVALSNIPSFNTEIVRKAWDEREQAARAVWRAEHPEVDGYSGPEYFSYSYIQEMWTDHIFVEIEQGGRYAERTWASIPYTVDGDVVTFGEAELYEKKLVPVYEEEEDLTDYEFALLADLLVMSSPMDRIHALAAKL